MMKRIITVIFIVSMIIMMGCGGSGINGNAPQVYEDVKEMRAEIKAGVGRIDIDAFKELYESDEMFVLLDVREPWEYDEGTIDGAMNLPRGNLEFKIGSDNYWDSEGMFAPEKDEAIFVFCEMIDRGAFAAETLRQLGYMNAKYIHGGYTAWVHGPDAIVEEVVEKKEEGCGS